MLKRCIALFLLLVSSASTLAEGWCDLKPGFTVATHGTKSEAVFILGTFEGRTDEMWFNISDGNIGQNNLSVAMAAQMAGKTLSVYVDGADDTCANFPSWAPIGRIRHLRIL